LSSAVEKFGVVPESIPDYLALVGDSADGTLATLRLDVRTFDTVDGLRWRGPCTDFEDCCRRLQSQDLFVRTISRLGNVPIKT
jgi:hypothetical protein